MKYRLPICFFFIFFLLAMPVFGQESHKEKVWEEVFYEANQDYRKGEFKKAAEGYQQLIRMGYDSPVIQYNLGNTWFRMHQLGRAIAAYERARIAMPRDADLNYNLAHAQDQLVDAIPPSKGFFSMAFFWLSSVSPGELFWSFAALNLLLWTALLIRLFHRPEWLFYSLVLLLCLWIITGLSFGIKWVQVHDDNRGVILKEEVAVLAGPHEGDTVLFKLHEGAIVKQERAEGKWRLIRLPDKKRGWLREEGLELIAQNPH